MRKKYFFVDLDETIITKKSMLSFMEFYFKKKRSYLRFYLEKYKLSRLYRAGLNRSDINRAYYKIYKNACIDEVENMGKLWFSYISHNKNFFNLNVINLLQIKLQQGFTPVIISGSFSACLIPIMKEINISHAIYTNLEVKENKYTGDLLGESVIGLQKKVMALEFLKKNDGVDIIDCAACADDISDLDLLESVGEKYIVPGNHSLEKIAKDRHWTSV